MRYFDPFTLNQKRIAEKEYKSYRKNLRLLRTKYVPMSPKERRLLRSYQELIRLFGLEAAKGLPDVGSEQLNDLASKANFVLAEYFMEKTKGHGLT